jgi:hypothetical protein
MVPQLIVFAHSHEAWLIPISILVLSGIGKIIWDLLKKKNPASSNSVSVGDHSKATIGVVGTGNTVTGDIIGNQNAIQNNFFISLGDKPIQPKESKEKIEQDLKARVEVEAIMKLSNTPHNKKRLREIFANTKDNAVKIQISLILGPWFDPTEDSIGETITLTEEAINLAIRLKARPELAALLSYKGIFYSTLYTQEYVEQSVKLAKGQGEHRGLMDYVERELKHKEDTYKKSFAEAKSIAEQEGNYEALVAVFLEIGQAAALRGAAFLLGDIPRRIKEKEAMRAAFVSAETIIKDQADRLPNNGELQIANLQHNLANNLRMFGRGEIEEALKIEREVTKVAEKYGDRALYVKSKFLLGRLEGKPVPDYFNGEKGESLI